MGGGAVVVVGLYGDGDGGEFKLGPFLGETGHAVSKSFTSSKKATREANSVHFNHFTN